MALVANTVAAKAARVAVLAIELDIMFPFSVLSVVLPKVTNARFKLGAREDLDRIVCSLRHPTNGPTMFHSNFCKVETMFQMFQVCCLFVLMCGYLHKALQFM